MTMQTRPERRACCPRPAPSRLPTLMVEAVATPKGKEMKRKTQSVCVAKEVHKSAACPDMLLKVMQQLCFSA